MSEDFHSDDDTEYEPEPEANDDLGRDYGPDLNDLDRCPTPWQVICPVHGPMMLTREQYMAQLSAADSLWVCPSCGRAAEWDDDNYEAHGAPLG